MRAARFPGHPHMSWLAAHWERVTPVSALLFPLSLLFRAAAGLRRAAYRNGLATALTLPVPVVVVGNLRVGGTGKTPAVLWLANFLRARGREPGIVSRGYGGRRTAPCRVTPDTDPSDCGDEPVLIARRSGCETWTGADRRAAAGALLAARPRCDVLISDDGLQHYGLARTVELCVVDAARGLGNGWLLPAGPLREPPSRLSSVDAIVVNEGDDATPAPGGPRAAGVPRFGMTLRGGEFYNLVNESHRALPGELRGRPLHAVAGIGDPDRFFRHLQRLGLTFVAHPFPDHHRFRAADLDFPGAGAVVMTEKDAVKCREFGCETHWVLPVEAEMTAGFGEFVLRRLDAAAGAGPGRRP
ncbi:MAG: tetraacyldisaccharide 4'-kinase [Burkholderiales bacterium]|nr:tetraacyldisaccharide 4'-kinase [Burkholderiales bacterium]